MDRHIGHHLGVLLAHFEYDSTMDPDDMETLQKICLISKAYRDFSEPEFGSFRADFQRGYKMGSEDVIREAKLEGAEPQVPAEDDPTVENDGPAPG